MRAKKLSMNVETLSVDSFETSEAPRQRGTVEGHAGECTCKASCACPSAPYWCAEAYQTLISCDYTHNQSCITPTA